MEATMSYQGSWMRWTRMLLLVKLALPRNLRLPPLIGKLAVEKQQLILNVPCSRLP
jgi:hypothetical protein